MKDGIRHPVIDRIFLSANFPGRPILSVSAEDLDVIPERDPVGFRDGELIRREEDGKIFVIANGERHAIASPAIFEDLGYQWKNVLTVPERILAVHPFGDTIDFSVQMQ